MNWLHNGLKLTKAQIGSNSSGSYPIKGGGEIVLCAGAHTLVSTRDFEGIIIVIFYLQNQSGSERLDCTVKV